MGVLAATLGRYRRGGALQDLEQCLLHAFAGHITGDRWVLGLAGDLVDLVDVDDPGLGLLDVEIGSLDQLQENVLDVLADVTGLGQRGRVRNGERNVEHACQRLGQEGLAATRRAQEQDVRLRKLDILTMGRSELNTLVVVVHGDREDLLGMVLADDVVVEKLVDGTRLGELLEMELGALRKLLLDDLVAQLDALVADVDPGAGDELLDLLLGLPAERTLQQVAAAVSDPCHLSPGVRKVSGASCASTGCSGCSG